MRNEHKIALIKHYLDQPNCVGVELNLFDEEDGSLLFVANGYNTNLYDDTIYFFDVVCNINFDLEWVEIIDYRPLPIELDDLKVGDRVWANGRMGEVEDFTLGSYDVSFNEDDWGEFERHELIKVMK